MQTRGGCKVVVGVLNWISWMSFSGIHEIISISLCVFVCVCMHASIFWGKKAIISITISKGSKTPQKVKNFWYTSLRIRATEGLWSNHQTRISQGACSPQLPSDTSNPESLLCLLSLCHSHPLFSLPSFPSLSYFSPLISPVLHSLFAFIPAGQIISNWSIFLVFSVLSIGP